MSVWVRRQAGGEAAQPTSRRVSAPWHSQGGPWLMFAPWTRSVNQAGAPSPAHTEPSAGRFQGQGHFQQHIQCLG